MYQALYRKWRPATFADMVGQEAVVQTLKNQVATGRVAHAYLFCGSRGTGKTSAAKIMARAVNCLHPADGDPCMRCEVCRALVDETTLDVIEIDAASNNGVDEIRDLREKVKYPPQHGRYKVYIIDEVHMLSPAAFNALLKTLEEPPAHAVFILATTEPQRLPATILSRCQRFDFGRISAEKIAGRLRLAAQDAGASPTPGALALIARAAEGGLRDALSILDMCLGHGGEIDEELVRAVLGAADRETLFAFAGALCAGDGGQALRLIDQVMREGRDAQVFARDMAAHLRALCMAKLCGDVTALLETTPEDAARYTAQADAFTQSQLLRAAELFLRADPDMRWASSPRVMLEVCALRACQLPQGGEALLERVEQLERRVAQLAAAPAAPVSPAAASETPAQPPAAPPAREAPAAGEALAAPETQTSFSLQEPPAAPRREPKAVWEDALRALRKTAPMLAGPLMEGRFAGCKGGVYRLVFTRDQSIFQSMLSQEAKKQQISDALTEAAGAPAQFEAVLEQPAPPAASSRVQQQIDTLIADFGRDKLQID